MPDFELSEKIIEFRRDLHRIPELDFDLPKTRKYLTDILAPLGCEIRDLGKAGFAAYFDNGKATTVAFRSDMDAIPLTEPYGSSYRSVHEGAMHACGHDGHMAILLGLALWIKEHANEIDSNVLMIFQAAEETTGGAHMICDTGILKEFCPQVIYGMHLWPGYPRDEIICRPGGFMAGTFVVTVDIRGQSAHIAEYKMGDDALEAGCIFINEAYAREASLPPETYRLMRFGDFHAGTTNNIIADSAIITGAIRGFDAETFRRLRDLLDEAAFTAEFCTGTKISLSFSEGYPPVINPKELYDETMATLASEGFSIRELEAPLMQAEDFAFYQREVPGIYLHLGTGVNTKLHSPNYELDEDVLITGVKIFRTLLLKNNRKSVYGAAIGEEQ